MGRLVAFAFALATLAASCNDGASSLALTLEVPASAMRVAAAYRITAVVTNDQANTIDDARLCWAVTGRARPRGWIDASPFVCTGTGYDAASDTSTVECAVRALGPGETVRGVLDVGALVPGDLEVRATLSTGASQAVRIGAVTGAGAEVRVEPPVLTRGSAFQYLSNELRVPVVNVGPDRATDVRIQLSATGLPLRWLERPTVSAHYRDLGPIPGSEPAVACTASGDLVCTIAAVEPWQEVDLAVGFQTPDTGAATIAVSGGGEVLLPITVAAIAVADLSTAQTLVGDEPPTFEWRVHNAGPDAATAVALFSAPGLVSFEVVSSPVLPQCARSTELGCTVPLLPAGGTATLRVVATGPKVSLATVAGPDSYDPDPTNNEQILTGDLARVLVSFKPGGRVAALRAIAAAGGRVSYESDDARAVAAVVPRRAIAAIAFVARVEDDPPRRLLGETYPWSVEVIQARELWDGDLDGALDPGAPVGAGRTVCIIDSGLRRDHPDLTGASVKGGVSLSKGPWDQDDFGHGTFVAGILAAQLHGAGTAGVAPAISLVIVRVADEDGLLSASTLMQAGEHCVAAGAHIINMSLGGATPSEAEERFWANVAAKGILLVAAAGNDGSTTPHYPASYASVISVAAVDAKLQHAPFSQVHETVELAAPGVAIRAAFPRQESFTVAAGDAPLLEGLPTDGRFARGQVSGRLEWGGDCTAPGHFEGAIAICNYGDAAGTDRVIHNMIDSGAAGLLLLGRAGARHRLDVDYPIVTIALDRLAGRPLVQERLAQMATLSASVVDAPGYRVWQGTSFATPHVAGVAALIWSRHPERSAAEVRAALDATARDLGAPGRDAFYGYGLVQARAALERLSAAGRSSE